MMPSTTSMQTVDTSSGHKTQSVINIDDGQESSKICCLRRHKKHRLIRTAFTCLAMIVCLHIVRWVNYSTQGSQDTIHNGQNDARQDTDIDHTLLKHPNPIMKESWILRLKRSAGMMIVNLNLV